jgi:hypothetical protein
MSQATRARPTLSFRHERVDDSPPCGNLFTCLPTDLTGTGVPDVVVTGSGRTASLSLPGRTIRLDNVPLLKRLYRHLEPTVCWYENHNPGWTRHVISPRGDLYPLGGALGDVDGDGRVDLVVGQALGGRGIYWLRQPADPRETWPARLVADDFEKYHDLALADVDDDGALELVGCSQRSETVFYYDVPDDPTVEPWPEECLHVVCEGIHVEGLLACDVDGDGATEIVAGPNVFHRIEGADGVVRWEREVVAEGWEWTRLAAADVDGDGDLELAVAEGDRPYNGDALGRVAVFDPVGDADDHGRGREWVPTLLHAGLSNPHSLAVADFDGDGHPDLFVAEMGLGVENPRQFVFRNRGDGRFETSLVGEGVPTHEATAVDLTGDGRPDVVGKSYHPTEHVDVWYNETTA